MTQQTTLILYIVIFIPFIYFVMIRPQQKQAKKRKTLMNGMKTRDVVITAGGLYGKITKVKEDSILMTIADKVEVEVAKTGILSIENRDINLEKA